MAKENGNEPEDVSSLPFMLMGTVKTSSLAGSVVRPGVGWAQRLNSTPGSLVRSQGGGGHRKEPRCRGILACKSGKSGVTALP